VDLEIKDAARPVALRRSLLQDQAADRGAPGIRTSLAHLHCAASPTGKIARKAFVGGMPKKGGLRVRFVCTSESEGTLDCKFDGSMSGGRVADTEPSTDIVAGQKAARVKKQRSGKRILLFSLSLSLSLTLGLFEAFP